MVLIETLAASELTPTNCNIQVEGGMFRAVVPRKYRRCLENTYADEGSHSDEFVDGMLCNQRRRLSAIAAALDETDRWEGVKDLIVALDFAIEVDHEADVFLAKRVLELGFVTGLLSAMAVKNGATSVHMHSWDVSNLDTYVKPTLRHNNVANTMCKFTSGNDADCKASLALQKYQVVLAPELLAGRDETEFSMLHEIIDLALADDGLLFLTARPHYEHGSASLPAFLDFLKQKGKFDAFIRWTSPRNGDIRPRKMLQIQRNIR